MAIIEKFEKWGKSAELLSFQKPPKQGSPKKGNDNLDQDNGSNPKSGKDSCSNCDVTSNSDDQKDVCKAHADKDSKDATKSNNISWKNPDLQTVTMQSTKSRGKKSFLGFIWKKKKKADHERKKGAPLTNNGPSNSKWQFPRVPVPPYDATMSYQIQQPYGPFPPPVMGRPPYQPYGFMQPMPHYPPMAMAPPPYGVFNSRPPPKVNPMVHYTSYADNYRFW
ncbi:hypothetical protein COLO4_37245 [Corchorus olitorius]|uniref:Uncharacterized protein n=1 Tax=Corchorus olitorius TaxID=93759 RepID=A0A1R3G2P2_9ROSI|nr:hypothetical protein COLO4_37245 [Corchorus olitorius]